MATVSFKMARRVVPCANNGEEGYFLASGSFQTRDFDGQFLTFGFKMGRGGLKKQYSDLAIVDLPLDALEIILRIRECGLGKTGLWDHSDCVGELVQIGFVPLLVFLVCTGLRPNLPALLLG